MKVIATACGGTVSDRVDPRFGRAAQFLQLDTETGKVTVHDNRQNLNAAQGAGIQAAETVVRLEAGAVITGNVGPKAFRVLSAAGIKVYLAPEGTVQEAFDRLTKGELKEAQGSNVEGHWA